MNGLQQHLHKFLWRLGRKIYLFARGDIAQDPQKNGEYFLLKKIISRVDSRPVVLMDVGANRGDWSLQAQNYSKEWSKNFTIHLFDPDQNCFAYWKKVFAESDEVIFNQNAISDNEGDIDFYNCGHMLGTNSIIRPDDWSSAQVMRVKVTSLDRYAASKNINAIDLVKVDAEGSDYKVLVGASGLLSSGAIKVCQFEYNHRWLLSNYSLRSVFLFIRGKPYKICRYYKGRFVVYNEWHFELERFFETNFLLVRSDLLSILDCQTKVVWSLDNTPHLLKIG